MTLQGLDEAAPTSAVRTVDDVGHPAQGEIRLEIDGETRQVGDLAQQIWAGVGPVRRGESWSAASRGSVR